mmetsp:Transcript_5972/g.14367  ORF Transcript_5972/g.14367 Transcript_5972/m.14367 type:complete len:114 (+) Transcript_5972:438-779(+)
MSCVLCIRKHIYDVSFFSFFFFVLPFSFFFRSYKVVKHTSRHLPIFFCVNPDLQVIKQCMERENWGKNGREEKTTPLCFQSLANTKEDERRHIRQRKKEAEAHKAHLTQKKRG